MPFLDSYTAPMQELEQKEEGGHLVHIHCICNDMLLNFTFMATYLPSSRRSPVIMKRMTSVQQPVAVVGY